MKKDVTSLPKWAQEHITTLQRVIAARDIEVANLRKEREIAYSTAFMDWYSENPIPLGTYPDFQFNMFNSDSVKARMYVETTPTNIRLHSDSGRLLVVPQAANTIVVRIEK